MLTSLIAVTASAPDASAQTAGLVTGDGGFTVHESVDPDEPNDELPLATLYGGGPKPGCRGSI